MAKLHRRGDADGGDIACDVDVVDAVDVRLLSLERTIGRSRIPSTSTVTFFRSLDRKGYASSIEYLRDRLNRIVHLNPWLDGRLHRTRLKVPARREANVPLEVHLHRRSGSGESPSPPPSLLDVSIERVTHIASEYVVKAGCCGGAEPIFRAAIIPFSDGSASQDLLAFAFVLSLSHVVGDGCTFYRIVNMFSCREQPYAMDPTRYPSVEDAIGRAMGRNNTAQALSTNPHFALSIACGMVKAKAASSVFRRTKRTHVKCFYIDQRWVDDQKKRAKKRGARFVSTNDVITWWFFTRCRADVGMMAVNFRQRVPASGGPLPGNYESLLPYRPADYASPELIRASMSTWRRASSPRTNVCPRTSLRGLRGSHRIAVITNWSGFASTMEISMDDGKSNVVAAMHHPMYHLADVGPRELAVCVIFRPHEGALACAVYGYGPNLMRRLPSRGELVSGPIYPLDGGMGFSPDDERK